MLLCIPHLERSTEGNLKKVRLTLVEKVYERKNSHLFEDLSHLSVVRSSFFDILSLVNK